MDVQLLGDRYELLDTIGRGGMATIYRARDRRMDRFVAAKVLREMYSSDPKFVLRFQREARAVSALAHPNIVQVFDYGQSGESYFIVMELVDGIDLRRYLRRQGVLDVRRAVVIAHDVALGLGAAHRRGIVHRDVKPQNILVNDDGLVKLTDFGIATFYRDSQAERLTTTGMTLGTVQYYAPEQAQGEVVSPAADVYALGIVLYEMLVGHPPFDGDTPVAIAVRHIQEQPVRPSRYNPNIPPTLERVILRCLEKDPRDRYRDGDALAAALETYDKPRASQPRMSAPVAAAGGPGYAPPPDMFDGRNSGPRPMNGMAMRDDVPGMLPTRAEPAAGTMPRSPSFGDTSEEQASSPVAGLTTAVIVASVLVLLGVSCFLAIKLTPLGSIFGGGSTDNTSQIAVPSLVGLNYNQAQQTLQQNHLVIQLGQQQTNTAPANTVINQNPPAGTKVAPNSTVTVDVSLGPPSASPVAVPSVLGETQDKACSDIRTAGLLCAFVGYVSSSSYPAQTVAQTSPQVGTQVQKDTTVDIWLSAGAATSTPVASPSPTATSATTPTPTSTPPASTPTPTSTPSSTTPTPTKTP
jgi:hypothetical protein